MNRRIALALLLCSSAMACGRGAAEQEAVRADLAKAKETRSSRLGEVRAAFAQLDGVAIPGPEGERCPLIKPSSTTSSPT
jgi:hypothetical protein